MDENNEDLCGDLEDFVNDRNLFNILDDVDMDLINGDLETDTNNFDLLFNDDNRQAAVLQNPAETLTPVQHITPLPTASPPHASYQPASSPVAPPGRSSVIVGRSKVTPVTPIVPKPTPVTVTSPIVTSHSSVLSSSAPAVQIIDNSRQPQVITTKLLVDNTQNKTPILFTNKSPNRPIVVTAPVTQEPAQRYIFEPDQMKLTPLKVEKSPGYDSDDDKVKTVRKAGHNDIEKRYRSSINDRIVELKNILSGEEAKMSKSAILRKAIEYIRFLQSKTARLEQENKQLKNKIQQFKEPRYSVLQTGGYMRGGPGSLSPPYSNPSHSPGSISDHCDHDTMSEFSTSSSPGMMDKSRLALCMVMFSVLLINPLSPYVEDHESVYKAEGVAAGGRSILEAEGPISYLQLIRLSTSSLLLSMFNVLLILAVLVRLFVFGEPEVQPTSMTYYWRYKKQAEADIEAGEAESAVKHLKQAASVLGRPVPVTFIDCMSSLFWQLLYFLLDKMKLPQLVKTLMRVNKKTNKEILWETAETYHKLHCVRTCSNDTGDVESLALALSALNFARHSHYKPRVMAEIYLLMTIRLKISWPKLPTFIQRNCLNKAVKILGNQEAAAGEISWIIHPESIQFLLTDNNMKKKYFEAQVSSTMSSSVTKLDPVTRLLRYYRDSLLHTALDTIICPSSESQLTSVVPMLSLVTRSNVMTGSLEGDRYDEVSDWWSSVLKCAALWSADKMSEAEQIYQDIDNLPELYQECEEPYYVTLLATQTTHRAVLAGDTSHTPALCHHASDFIEQAVRHYIQSKDEENTAIKNMLVLCLDWQLSSRTMLWESEISRGAGQKSRCSEAELQGFQKDVLSLRRLTEQLPWLQNRLFLHEATLRMMAGASPNKTQQLLDKSSSMTSNKSRGGLVCGRDRDVYIGEREHALALMLACKHLPQQLYTSKAETTGMLIQAAAMLDSLGDKRLEDQCHKLMAKLSSNCS